MAARRPDHPHRFVRKYWRAGSGFLIMGSQADRAVFKPPAVGTSGTPSAIRSIRSESLCVMDWITTSTLLEDLADADNHTAWERFVGRFRAPMVRFACGMGLSDADAEDVAQETLLAFAEAYRQGRYDRSQGRLSRWLFGIAFRQALGRRRSGARDARLQRQAPTSAFWDQTPDEETASRLWDQQWEQAVLEACLRRVREEVEPMTWRAFERICRSARPAAEVAGELGIEVKAVYNAKYTVMKRIRELRADLERQM